MIRFLRTSPTFRQCASYRQFASKTIINPAVEKNRIYNSDEGYMWKSGYKPVELPDMTLDQYIWKDLNKWQDKIALECSETQRSYTYAELRDCCAAFAIRLQTVYKLKPGDIVALVVNNIPEFAIALFGALEAGLTVSTINPAYTPDEIARQISVCPPKLIVAIPSCYPNVLKACELSKLSAKTVVVKTDDQERLPAGAVDFYELINSDGVNFNDLVKTDRSTNDICLLPFSSGTTGLPKGVMLSHRNLITSATIMNGDLPDEGVFRPTTNDNQDKMLCFLPLFHLAGLQSSVIPKLATGVKLVTMPAFTADGFLCELLEHQPDVLVTVPSILMLLSNHPNASQKHLESLRTIICGASNIGEQDVYKLIEKKPTLEFIQLYGMTETGPIATISHKKGTNYKTIGWPGPNVEIKIAKPDDALARGLDVNEEGEILIRGPNVMKGYFNNDQATKDALLPNGWLRTGDAGYYDQDGFIYMTDRLKDLIKVQSYQVPPAELEEIIRTHPMVAEVGVVGIKHAKSGEVPRAFVVCKPGCEVSEKELKDFVADKVVAYKRLEGGVKFLSALPKNTTGKVLRRQLKLLEQD